jgi:hypothetical protein
MIVNLRLDPDPGARKFTKIYKTDFQPFKIAFAPM